MIQLSCEAEEVLSEILAHEDESNYWPERFGCLSKKEDAILRGCFKELKENNMVSVMWAAPGIPYHITILKDGYLYESKKEQYKVAEAPIITRGYKQYDVFISHANQDKLDFVDGLKSSLDKLGISIFYDIDSLEWGDNWKERILSGVANAEFAIIVISENFFGREWTERELAEFLTRQNESGQKIVLPVAHNISFEQFAEKYPQLSHIQAISSEKYSTDEISILFARQLIKRLKAQ